MRKIYLIFILCCGLFEKGWTQKSYSALSGAFAAHISSFKLGVSNDSEFERMHSRFSAFLRDVEFSLKLDPYNAQLKDLLKTAEAVTTFIGEIGPDATNHFLRLDQFDIALRELGLTYKKVEDENAMPHVLISLWNKRYQVIMIVNFSECMYNFKSTVFYDYNDRSKVGTTELSGGVDYKTMRDVGSQFTVNKQDLLLIKLQCTKTEHCNWRNR